MTQKISERLVYPVADVLQLPLHDMNEQGIRGAGNRTLTVGAVQLSADIVVRCTGYDAHRAVYTTRIVGDLWALIGVRLMAGGRTEVKLAMFDGNELGIKPKGLSTMPVSIADTLANVAPAVKCVLEYNQDKKLWIEHDTCDLDGFLPE